MNAAVLRITGRRPAVLQNKFEMEEIKTNEI